MYASQDQTALNITPSRVGVRGEEQQWDCDICHSWPWCTPTIQAVWFDDPSENLSGSFAGASGPGWGTRVTSRAAVCSAGLGSISGPEDPEPAGEPWYAWPFMSRMSHSQSQEEAMLACWRKPLILIINDMSLNGVGPEQANCSIALSCNNT